jgi:hypothetical protein
MAKTRKLPYLRKVGQRDRIGIWIMDGSYIRAHIDEESPTLVSTTASNTYPRKSFGLTKVSARRSRNSSLAI